MKISKLIYAENKWAKDCLAEYKEGKKIYSFDRRISLDGQILDDPSEKATKYSLDGAITKLYNPNSREPVLSTLKKAIQAYTGENVHISKFNNSSNTKYEDIKKVLQIAKL